MSRSIVDLLEEEHRSIEIGLQALERATASELDWELLTNILAFLRGYADHFHHAKEEDLLFPRLTERGLPAESGPIGCMLEEHETGRGHMRVMAMAIEQKDTPRLRAAARSYIQLLREHIAKEDGILFPMARRALHAHDEQELLQRAAHVAVQLPEAEALRRDLPRLLSRAFSATHS